MTMNAVLALPPEALNVSQPHSPRMTSRMRPFRKFWPGKVCGFSNFPSSFRYAMMLPENESEPMSVANSIGTAMNAVIAFGGCATSVVQKFQARDQRRRAAAEAVEQRDHLRHRGHLHRIRADRADDQADDRADGDERVIETPALRPDVSPVGLCSATARSTCPPPR